MSSADVASNFLLFFTPYVLLLTPPPFTSPVLIPFVVVLLLFFFFRQHYLCRPFAQVQRPSPDLVGIQQRIHSQAGQDHIRLARADVEGLLKILQDRQVGVTAWENESGRVAEEPNHLRCLTRIGDYAGSMYNRLASTGAFSHLLDRPRPKATDIQKLLVADLDPPRREQVDLALDKAAKGVNVDPALARLAIQIYASRNDANHSKAGNAKSSNDNIGLQRAIAEDLADLPGFLSSEFLEHIDKIRQLIVEYRDCEADKTTDTSVDGEKAKANDKNKPPLPMVYRLDLPPYLRPNDSREVFELDPSFFDAGMAAIRAKTRPRSRSVPDRSEKWVKQRRIELFSEQDPLVKRPRLWQPASGTDKTRYPKAWDLDPEYLLQTRGHQRVPSGTRELA